VFAHSSEAAPLSLSNFTGRFGLSTTNPKFSQLYNRKIGAVPSTQLELWKADALM
jgi:hypothetical protein